MRYAPGPASERILIVLDRKLYNMKSPPNRADFLHSMHWRGSAQGSLVQRELSAQLTEGLLR